ncbi:MAG TPA: tetratricopeptide repeat protein [Bryobacteraceae bacterium]|nr:tetratricopeptide repeat protein [Bryobacteraceae bacterium]
MVIPCLFLILGTGLLAQTSPQVPDKRSLLPAASIPDLTPAPVRPAQAAAPVTPEVRGDICMARKMYREAAEAYREGPADSAILQNKIGIAYHQMLLLDQARKQYEKAVRMSPGYSEAINNLGTIYYARKSYRRAIHYYRKALHFNPNSASIHSNLGTAYFARKKYQEAFDTYQKALQLDPEVFEHRGANGVLLQERSVTERARFHFYLAKTYAKAGNVERALLYMRKAIEEGFKERNKFQEDPEFTTLRGLPEFQQLLVLEARVL